MYFGSRRELTHLAAGAGRARAPRGVDLRATEGCRVTTWMAEGVTGKSGSACRADMMTWQARRMSSRRSWWSTAAIWPPRSGRRLSASRSCAMNSSGGRPVRWPLGRVPLPLETSVPGVFAVGDVRYRSIKRVASAVGDGATAVRVAHEYLAA